MRRTLAGIIRYSAIMTRVAKFAVLPLTLLALPSLGQAETLGNPFECLRTRSAELSQYGPPDMLCTSIAIAYCHETNDPTDCLASIPNGREAFIDSLLSRFPDDVDDHNINRFAKIRYSNALAELRQGDWRHETAMDPEDCFALGAPQAVCDVMYAMEPVTTVLHWAEILGLSWIDT